jgi:hypothetical protein
MKPTFERLMRAARELQKKTTPSEVGKLIDESDQTMSNWKGRGVPKAKHIDIAKTLGCDPEWLATGVGEMRRGAAAFGAGDQVKEPEPRAYAHPNETIAQIVSLLEATDDVGRGIGLMAVSQALERYRPIKENAA